MGSGRLARLRLEWQLCGECDWQVEMFPGGVVQSTVSSEPSRSGLRGLERSVEGGCWALVVVGDLLAAGTAEEMLLCSGFLQTFFSLSVGEQRPAGLELQEPLFLLRLLVCDLF